MESSLKIGSAQLGPISLAESRYDVVKRLLALLYKAHSFGVKFIVFPELALTTFFPRYWMTNQVDVDRYFETKMPNEVTQPLFDAAKKLGIGFYLGFAELSEEDNRIRRFNTSILVGPDGKIIGKYRKIHLPGHSEKRDDVPFQHLEKRYFEVGNLGFGTWPVFGTRVGMAICNDRRWPETYRVMALRGARVVVLGFNTPTENINHDEPLHLRMFHHRLVMQAAAYQNGMWIVATAKAGYEDGFHLHGGSCIISPTGEIVSQSTTEDDEVIVYDCNLKLGDYILNSVFNFKKHRRIEHYGPITSQTGVDDLIDVSSKL
uniref:N-carbamoyl-D-amino-acid hydrolase n=1 Tax=Hirondellea gigas TaxID=1518452 RepID=A0A6A7G463_9CRUS